ncbi:MAG TPA: ABC transporter ATP-binding protein [Phycisphaerales bacterium]|nr:ABC transporter ATP-binding protein [Phycisphaerales bacterium]
MNERKMEGAGGGAVVVEPRPRANKSGSGGGGSAPMIEAEGLTKMYGDFYAVREVSFAIPRGQVVAFLGPNGAGKSTTMKLLTGVLAPTSGRARICGVEMQLDRLTAAERVGYLPESGPLYLDMTPRSLLQFFARARGMDAAKMKQRVDYVVEHCRLSEVIGKPIGKLSKGYRQRVGMAQALLHDPEVLILDEPTAGLDPNQTEHVRELLRSLARTKTILLSTHILSEVRAVAQRVLFVHQGRLVHDGSVASLGENEQAMEERFHRMSGQ